MTPSPDKAAVAAVRPLIWEAHNVDKTIWSTEVSVTGEYLVKFTGKEWQASKGLFIVGTGSTSDEAKTAAQQFHASRILSALDPAFLARIEALEAENVRLREALEPFADFADLFILLYPDHEALDYPLMITFGERRVGISSDDLRSVIAARTLGGPDAG